MAPMRPHALRYAGLYKSGGGGGGVMDILQIDQY